jgi:hypothetical protein
MVALPRNLPTLPQYQAFHLYEYEALASELQQSPGTSPLTNGEITIFPRRGASAHGAHRFLDATSVGGQPDPLWSLIGHVMQRINSLTQRIGNLELEVARVANDVSQIQSHSSEDDQEMIIFGPPKKVTPVKIKMGKTRRGVPAFVFSEDDE